MGRRRIPEPAVLAIALFAAALIAAAVVLAGCDSTSEEDARTPERSGPSASLIGPASDVAYRGSASMRTRAIAQRCRWDRHGIGTNDAGLARAVLRNFADPGGGPVRLLLERAIVRPGAILEVAVANDGKLKATYGLATHAESIETGEPLEIDGPLGAPLIAIVAQPDSVGSCAQVFVPSDTASGTYRAVLDDFGVGRCDGEGTGSLSVAFEVAGDPIPNPLWERRLEAAGGRG